MPRVAFAIPSTARRGARVKPGRRGGAAGGGGGSPGGWRVTTSSGKRTTSAFASRACSSHSTTLDALPSRSPTTLLICASASLIARAILGSNGTPALVQRCTPPADVEADPDEEDGEA